MIRFFITAPPTGKVRVDESLGINTQAVEHPKQRVQILPAWSTGSIPLIECAGDLIQVPTDGTDLGNGALEYDEFSGWQRRYRAQM